MRGISVCIHSFSAALLLAAAFWPAGAHAQILVHFDLPAQPLARSLKAIGAATNTDVGFNASQVAGLLAPPLKAELTVDGALMRVLAGTGLRPQHLDDHTIVIAAIDASASNSAEIKPLPMRVSALAEVDDQTTPPLAEAMDDSTEKSSQPTTRKNDLEEIVVTGTHIRGVTDSASPIQVYTRDDIDRAGVATVAEFIQRLSQNFNGGASDNTSFTGVGQSDNNVAGSGVNLRGLGNDATLVLLNGHRLAPGNVAGNFVDISMIPLSAIDHIDVVTDGASAIYGSDAVAGVVNFVLRRNFEGAESRVKYGAVYDGSSHEVQVGQAFGKNWGSGSALLSYEYYDRTPLTSAGRSYAHVAPLPTFDLFQQQLRQSLFATLNQTITSGIEIFGDGSFSHRATEGNYGYPEATLATSYLYTSSARINAYNGTIGSRIALPGRTQLELSATYGNSDTDNPFYVSIGNTTRALNTDPSVETSVGSLDAKLDGPLASLPAGNILFAVGGQFRRETLRSVELVSERSNFRDTRNVTAGFAELHIPIVGSRNSSSQLARLELSLAARAERYSDFGSTTNPQAGLAWNVSDEFRLRGTYGKSFKAPNLVNLTSSGEQIVPFPGGAGGPIGPGPNTIEIFGGNPNLQPERARTWTAGLDVHPTRIPELKASVTYYAIKFDNEIVTPNNLIESTSLFSFQSILGPTLLQLNPSSAELQRLESSPGFINPFGVDLSTIGAVFDTRSQNLSVVTTRGIDLQTSYRVTGAVGTFDFGLDATYILSFDNQVTPITPATSTLNTPYNPIDLKFRGRATYTRGPLAVSAFLNYVNSYTDNRTTPAISVASWTTVDATLAYKFPQAAGPFKNAAIIGAILNIGNRAPPFVSNPSWPINYDGANANPLGRYLSLQISKRWW